MTTPTRKVMYLNPVGAAGSDQVFADMAAVGAFDKGGVFGNPIVVPA